MLAIDTNLLLRAILDDEPAQGARARALMAANEIFVATTVLLETEWVLRSTYKLTRQQIAGLLRSMAGLPNVNLEHPDRAMLALDLAERGMDFADALHLGASQECSAFVSFDNELVRQAARWSKNSVKSP